jgi:ribosomal protein L40E
MLDKDLPPMWYDSLHSKYPNVFRNLKHLECGEGWHTLLDKLCSIIEGHITNEVPEELKEQIFAVQIKEKFGGLRFYMSATTPYIDGAISFAELFSFKVCENCGASADPNASKGRWVKSLKSLCSSCYGTHLSHK